ncbi:MAG TPA: galactose oxidase-like domain-containing protein [Gemmatimonadales bacterium]|nr:galactose oxidase-like domain-containing protein [Gemmatimonadales bacterium]
MPSFRCAGQFLIAAALVTSTVTCGGDNLTRSTPESAEPEFVAGPAAKMTMTIQPPATALDREVWDPTRQPKVVVKDAANVAVAGVVVTASIASGSGTLQGSLTATTKANGSATFTDLGIAGTGPHTLRFTTGTISATSSSVTLSALPSEATTGKWDPPVPWDIVPLHLSLLPTAKLLGWGKFELDGSMGMPRLWDPTAGTPTGARMVRADTMLFCSGHTLMADGRLMVSGGHKADDRGLDVTNIFDPVTEGWVAGLPKMAKGRWYPTATTLADGRVVTVAGRDTTSSVVLIPEVWENNHWVQLPGASLRLPYYPRQFVAPNGKLFYAGERIKARYLDVDAVTANGRGRWSSLSGFNHLWPFNRDYGSAVMYDTGKILYAGGGGDLNSSSTDPKNSSPTPTAETIDLNIPSGSHWSSTDDMHFRRRHLNATILPDGLVLVTGGTTAGGFNNLSGAVHEAEVWDPQTGHWSLLAGNTIDRAYHSVSLLLPDGTVLHGASGDASVPGSTQLYPRQANHEIFRPPYLFKGVRPTISGLSKTTVTYGETFTVSTAYAAQITQVRWIRLGSVTHAFDAGQRANTLAFSRGTGLVRVMTPSTSRRAPPGYYLLFVLNRNRVPSLGKIVQVR